MKNRLKKIVPQSWKNAYHAARALLAAIVFGFPGKELTLIGITGTNGKTTTSEMVYRILAASGTKTALASTIRFAVPDGEGNREWTNTSKFTTVSAWQLQSFLRTAKRAGATHAVLEVSSHALDQHRLWGLTFAVAVGTNLTREHLDYHKTMEGYCAAKQKLFRKASAAVINKDAEHFQCFAEAAPARTLLYSTKDKSADLCATGIQLDFSGTEFRVGETFYRLRLPGIFNIENALAAIAVARLLNIPDAISASALSEIRGVPGRMELVENTRGVDIIIDYAVTPDAFTKLYESVLPLKIPGTKIIHVFGACGDRDRGKRPELARIASRNADIVILTNEDPYTEDPERIIDELEKGIESKPQQYFRIFDRRAAIEKALSLAERGDIVLVTGKGAETSMAFADHREPWKERQVIEELLSAA